MNTPIRTASLAALAGFLALAGAAPQALARPAAPSAADDSCRMVMGLQTGEEHYVNCLQSLQASQDSLGRGRALTAAREGCLDKGFKPGSPDLAVCTLKTKAAPAPLQAVPVSSSAKSWFMASSGERHRREQLACARIGLDPTSGAFDSCVAGLASALFAADNPQN